MIRRVYQKPTIDDVAREARVSKSTVSHFINGRQQACSAETGARIRNAIAELNFVPARSILHQQARPTQTVGVCVSPPPRNRQDFEYTHLHEFWHGITSVADVQGYRLQHYPRVVREGDDCDPFLDGSIDGLIISASQAENRFERLAKAGLPTVAVTRWTKLPGECAAVWANEQDIVELALTHLWDLGHRRIAHWSAVPDPAWHTNQVARKFTDAAQARCGYFLAWLRERDAADPSLILSSRGFMPVPHDEAVATLDQLMQVDRPPTAVLCANDAIAWSALEAAAELKIMVPDDLSIVGVDNNESSADFDPPLTTVEMPFWEIGSEAMRTLDRLLKGEAVDCRNIATTVSNLVVRRSTCPPKGAAF
ncbi:MAG: LacI family DNA-binding transcriptional regulator [Capsulimonadaceae bacterium]|nr:LacI family DNA-binding transcriptional regulator [Capsulimonadaceae bacterium]